MLWPNRESFLVGCALYSPGYSVLLFLLLQRVPQFLFFVFMLPLLFYYLSPAVRCFRWLVDGFFITESRVKSEASQCGI